VILYRKRRAKGRHRVMHEICYREFVTLAPVGQISYREMQHYLYHGPEYTRANFK
jgi:hypothetical protein